MSTSFEIEFDSIEERDRLFVLVKGLELGEGVTWLSLQLMSKI